MIEYPTPWTYKVIGREETALRSAIREILPNHQPQVTLSNTSRGDRYLCLNVEVVVYSDAERVSIYERLRVHEATVIVL